MSPNIHRALDATETGIVIPRTALFTVSDKTGLVQFAQDLQGSVKDKVHILSTGGTATTLRNGGLDVQDVGEYTEYPEELDGRVKTLHPKVHGGLLAARGNREHMETLERKNTRPIDIAVVNFYPFREAIKVPGVTFAQAIENIDIGGPAVVRGAAKNWDGVAVVTDPADYALIIADILKHGGVTRETRLYLMKKAFAIIADYDTAIAEYLTPDNTLLGQLIRYLRSFKKN